MKKIILLCLILFFGCVSSNYTVDQVKLKNDHTFISTQMPNFQLETDGLYYAGVTKGTVNKTERQYVTNSHYFVGENNEFYIRVQLSTIRFATWTEFQPWQIKTETEKFGNKYFESGIGKYDFPFPSEGIEFLKKHGISESPTTLVSKAWVYVPPVKNKGTRIVVRYFENDSIKLDNDFSKRANERVKFRLL